MKSVTTKHPEIGYRCNVEIIEQALRTYFGFDDNSHVLTAVAAHIWSGMCGGSEEKTWGDPEVLLALAQVQARLTKMVDAIKCNRTNCAIGYPHTHFSR